MSNYNLNNQESLYFDTYDNEISERYVIKSSLKPLNERKFSLFSDLTSNRNQLVSINNDDPTNF